jgi:hypothetical protein|tara:strand:- start:583 stop:789 length:207 start_codon:yes stop_codon:yes gene_type:complete
MKINQQNKKRKMQGGGVAEDVGETLSGISTLLSFFPKYQDTKRKTNKYGADLQPEIAKQRGPNKGYFE